MLTNHNSSKSKKWRYLGTLPLMALMIVLFHTPADQGMAVTTQSPIGEMRTTVPLFSFDGVPSQFPLPEIYKENITWDYNQEAIHPISKKEVTHMGIDVAAPSGTEVFAAGDGIVKKAVEEKGWGKMIVLEHEDGYATFYAHLDKIEVESGVKVKRGELIGRVGNTGQSTGPHLHYEVRLNGEHLNPADFY